MSLKKYSIILTLIISCVSAKQPEILNVSFDSTRELFKEINKEFHQKNLIYVRQSHSSSGRQARSITYGLKANIASLSMPLDLDYIAANTKYLDKNWRQSNLNNSAPYYSTVVFLVRDGNPHQIKDWDDLANKKIDVMMPNPKTSGGARWNYLAAYFFAREKLKTEDKINEFMQKLIKNVLFFDVSARASATNFLKRSLGDVLIIWENEAKTIKEKFPQYNFHIVNPSVSIKTDFPVVVIKQQDENANEHANLYLNFLYSDQVQKIFHNHHYRNLSDIADSKEKLIEIRTKQEWENLKEIHFNDGGLFDTFRNINLK